MRTVNNLFLSKLGIQNFPVKSLIAIAGMLFLGAGHAYAQANTFAPPPMMMPPLATNAMVAANGAAGAEMDRNVSSAENKVTDNAKSLIKNLDSSSDALTLEDLNSARQTIARIDAIIDVEKHLAELEKIRNERTGAKATSSLASVIPASALTPPPSIKPVEIVEREVPKPVVTLLNPEISRIMGSEGKYTAVLKINGDMKTVRAGDQLSGNATVRYISSSSVVIDENGQTKTLHIKNVDAIYSAMR